MPLRRMLFALAIAALLPVLAIAQSSLAPGDEYFGKMKMSALGVRYAIQHLKIAAYHHATWPQNILHDTLQADDALYDWSKKYPKDTWLAQTAWGLVGLYEMIPGSIARNHAQAALDYLVKVWPKTKYAHDARLLLKNGLPPQPAEWTMPTPAPAATPSPSPAPSAPASPGLPAPPESPVPTDNPLPRPTAS
jgi:hypothetical protein